MPLELRIESDGNVRPFWYGRFKIEGKRLCQNLGVKVAGTPPASLSLKDQGDTPFEVSRASAQAKLTQIVEEARSKRDSARLVEKPYEIKTGEQIESVKLDDLGEEWARIPPHQPRRDAPQRPRHTSRLLWRRLLCYKFHQNRRHLRP